MARTTTAKPAAVAPAVPLEIQSTSPITFVDTVPQEDDDIDLGPLKLEELPEGAKEKYFESVGRRKKAIARVRLMTRKSGDEARGDSALMTVNGKDYLDYFTDAMLRQRVEQPLKRLKSLNRFKVSAKVLGGGISGQADAVRHGISRTLELFDANFRKKLKKAGFLTRDSRRVERKKPGLKKARKGPRWAKR
jgi:small subunit ribosomal protein S9